MVSVRWICAGISVLLLGSANVPARMRHLVQRLPAPIGTHGEAQHRRSGRRSRETKERVPE